MTTKFTKADVQNAATKLAKEKIEREPQRFGKIHDPAARLSAARTEIYLQGVPRASGSRPRGPLGEHGVVGVG